MPDFHPVRLEPVKLAADLYLPNSGAGPWPVILIQTPYGKFNTYLQFLEERADDPLFNSPHYAFVVMDWRGFGLAGSQEMDYEGNPDRGEDGYAAVEWIADQSWCAQRKVGLWGASALGNVQYKTAELQPPSLVCAVPMVYHWREWYDQAYPGGVYSRNRNDFVYGYFGGLTTIKALPLKNVVWQNLEANTGDPFALRIPVLSISGWYDHETQQTIREMQDVQLFGGPGAAGQQKLLIGPWSHGEVGMRRQNELEFPLAEFADSLAALDFYDFHLRGVANGFADSAPIRFYQINEDVWLESQTWPPAFTREETYYLNPAGSLDWEHAPEQTQSVDWTSDPGHPAPSLYSALVQPQNGDRQGPGDLSALEARTDVAVFTMPVRTEPLAVTGQPKAVLWVRCSAVDTDLHVRLTQVRPDGQSIWLADGVRRASLRNGFSRRELLDSATVYEVEVEIAPIAVTIPVGHSLRLLALSANYDRFDVNLQDGSDFSDEEGGLPTVATVSLHCGGPYPSRLLLPAWKGSDFDADGDSLPDWWEAKHFGDVLSADPLADPDGDGLDNLRELAAGTDPHSPASAFRLDLAAEPGEPARAHLVWSSVTGRYYEVLESTDLNHWTPLHSRVAATAPLNRLEIAVPEPASARFFRVTVERW